MTARSHEIAGDVYVVKSESSLFIWEGEFASKEAKTSAAQYASGLVDDDNTQITRQFQNTESDAFKKVTEEGTQNCSFIALVGLVDATQIAYSL